MHIYIYLYIYIWDEILPRYVGIEEKPLQGLSHEAISIMEYHTLPQTNSSPLKIGHPKRKGLSSNHPFSGATLVSGRVKDFKHYLTSFHPLGSGTLNKSPTGHGGADLVDHFCSPDCARCGVFWSGNFVASDVFWG